MRFLLSVAIRPQRRSRTRDYPAGEVGVMKLPRKDLLSDDPVGQFGATLRDTISGASGSRTLRRTLTGW